TGRKVRLEALGEAIRPGDESAVLVAGPDAAIRCPPDEHTEWQIKTHQGSRNHQRSSRPRIAEDQHLLVLHVEAGFARSGTVINPGENSEAFAARGFVEAAHGFVDGVGARFRTDSVG